MADSAFARHRRSRQRGTTLVELLVVLIIMSIVTSMILVTGSLFRRLTRRPP